MTLALIVAMARNNVIGRDNAMPWHQPDDLRYFKRMTLGKPVIMGRRTFDSIGRKPLPGRPNIVVTRDRDFRAEGITVAGDFEAALRLARQEAARLQVDEIAVIGGGALYAETLPRADRLYLTEVHGEPEGDAHFPAFDRAAWREVARDGPHQNPGETFSYSFVTLDRR